MEKNTIAKIATVIGIAALPITAILITKSCNHPVTNPAIEKLQSINDSLYKVIEQNNAIADSLFDKIDSLDVHQDTIIQQQQITNEYYRNETYNILNSSANDATAKFRSTLKKSDSLLKAGFYTRTYNLRSAAFQSQLQ